MIPEINRLGKHNEYLFMQERARAHTAKLTFEMLKNKEQLGLPEPHHWPPNSPDLNPVGFRIWGLPGQNLYRGQRITNLDSLKEAIAQEWNEILSFKLRLRHVIEVESRHIEQY